MTLTRAAVADSLAGKEGIGMAKKKSMKDKINEQLRKWASKGGKARAKNLTPEQLSEIGKKGGRPRKKPVDKS